MAIPSSDWGFIEVGNGKKIRYVTINDTYKNRNSNEIISTHLNVFHSIYVGHKEAFFHTYHAYPRKHIRQKL